MFLENFKMSILICLCGGIGAILLLLAMKNFNTSFRQLSFIGKLYRIICLIVLIAIVIVIFIFIIKFFIYFIKLLFL